MPKPEPQLPEGTSSTFQGLAETFSFHSSPETFITSRILAFHEARPDLIDSRAVIRAKVLNRNVAVVSSHSQILQVLNGDAAGYEACGAYDKLMAPFFPSPNLLLTDGERHEEMRKKWEKRMGSLRENLIPLVQRVTHDHFQTEISLASELDLYDCMKTLSWKLLIGALLGLDSDSKLFETIEGLQEELLRGQFSLFPVTLSTGFWSSPRKRGIDAKTKLQTLILEHFKKSGSACPFSATDDGALEDAANHTVLFSSSLAVKGLASLLTAFFLNLYLYRNKSGQTLADGFANENDHEQRRIRLRSVLLETERLSPPIVGIMRRSTKDNIIASPGEQADVKVPAGWDCWLYFVGGGRDPAAFGSTWDTFDPGRYADSSVPEGLAFGGGAKVCLGVETIREIALTVVETTLRLKFRMEGDVTAQGVRGWLGWEPNSAVQLVDWANDMKQLPTQRPSKPVMVRLTGGSN
jgi:cytochrome P450